MDLEPNRRLSRFKLDSELEPGKYARKREDHDIVYRHLTKDCEKHEYEFNYCKAAYKEVMRLAKDEGILDETNAILGDLDDLVDAFRTLPPPGKKIEFSVAKAIIPGISPDKMQRIMMDENYQWCKSLFPIVTKQDSSVNPSLDHLRARDPSIWNVVQVRTEMQLPSTLVPTRYFEFLRYRKRIEPLLYIIVDFSSSQFANSFAMSNSKRRPSGIIIKFRDDTGEPEGCEIIWIENVEVDETRENNMYSTIINSNLVFGAHRCISTLLHNLKRDRSSFSDCIINVAPTAGSFLLAYTKTMKHFFMECVCQNPQEDILTVKSTAEDPIRIMQNKTIKEDLTFVGVASFRIQAKPLSVFQFLMKKNIELEHCALADSVSETNEEVHEGAEQTDEVHEESEKTDGEVHEESEKTDGEIHEKSEQTDEVNEEPKQTDEVNEEPKQTDEVHEKSENIDGKVHEEFEKTDGEIHEKSEKTDEVHEKSEQTDEVHEEFEKTDGEVHEESEKSNGEVHEEPEKIDEVYEEPEKIDGEVYEESEKTNGKVHEEPEKTDEVHEEPEKTDGEVSEESEKTDEEISEESEKTDGEIHEKNDGEVHEESEKTNGEVHEEPEKTDEVHEEPEKTDGEVHEESEKIDGEIHDKTDEVDEEPEQTDEVHEEFEKTDVEIHEEPEQIDEEVQKTAEQTDENHEKPEVVVTFDTEQSEKFEKTDGEVNEEPEHTDEEVQKIVEQTDEKLEKPEVVVTFGTDDKNNIISLHRVKMNELENDFILQEASMDEHCSFILSKTLSEEMVDSHIVCGMKSKYDLNETNMDNMTSIGFAIIPDGRGGLDCDACLVTFLTQTYYEPGSADVNVESVRKDVVIELNDIIKELNENVVEEGKMTEYF